MLCCSGDVVLSCHMWHCFGQPRSSTCATDGSTHVAHIACLRPSPVHPPRPLLLTPVPLLAVALQLLLGYLPPDPSEWDEVLARKRTEYFLFCEVRHSWCG